MVRSVPPPTGPSAAPSPQGPPTSLLPCLRPPSAIAPPHPPRPSLPPPPSGWVRSVHAAPAAWPKQSPQSTGTLSRSSTPWGPEPAGEDVEVRRERQKKQAGECIAGNLAAEGKRHSAAEARNSEQLATWLSVERWRRSSPQGGGATMVFAHANGLNKELWYPALHRLLATNPDVDDIWLVDDTHHGVSVDLNAGLLSSAVTWDDGARNLVNLVRHVIPHASDGWQLGWHDAPSSPSAKRFIGVGHSIGGNNVILASTEGVWSAVFFTDPMAVPLAWKGRQGMALTTLKRRDTWPSLEAARAMRTSPLCKPWSDDVFELWLKTSLVPAKGGDGAVTLATPRWCEATCFASPTAPDRAWDLLASLDVPSGFLMAEQTGWMGGDALSHEMCHRPRGATNEVSTGGHLSVQEQPEEVAAALARFLDTLKPSRARL